MILMFSEQLQEEKLFSGRGYNYYHCIYMKIREGLINYGSQWNGHNGHKGIFQEREDRYTEINLKKGRRDRVSNRMVALKP